MRYGRNCHLGVPELKQDPGPLLVCFKIITVDYLNIITKGQGRTSS